MPDGTCAAVPTDLFALAANAQGGAARLRRLAPVLAESLARLVHSGSTGRPSPSVLELAGRLRRHHRQVDEWANRVADVGQAFAAVGAGGGLVAPRAAALVGGVAGVVTADVAAVDAVLALPDGRARTLDQLRRMSPQELVDWFRALQRLDGFDHPDFRAVEGLLLAVAAGAERDGARSVFQEPGFDLADAEVLLTMQDGWLAAQGARVPARHRSPVMREAHATAVDGWSRYFQDAPRLQEWRQDELWAAAEEQSVRTAEELLRERGMGFGPGMLALVPFTHSFRVAVVADREGELVESVLDHVDLRPLRDRAAVVAGALAEQYVEEHPGVVDHIGMLTLPVLPPLATALHLANRVGLADEIAGVAVERAVGAVPVELAGELPELLDRVHAGGVVDIVGELVVDPSATPPVLVRQFLDHVIGHPAPVPDASAAYYVARLHDLGLLPGLGDVRPFPDAVPDPLPVAPD